MQLLKSFWNLSVCVCVCVCVLYQDPKTCTESEDMKEFTLWEELILRGKILQQGCLTGYHIWVEILETI